MSISEFLHVDPFASPRADNVHAQLCDSARHSSLYPPTMAIWTIGSVIAGIIVIPGNRPSDWFLHDQSLNSQLSTLNFPQAPPLALE